MAVSSADRTYIKRGIGQGRTARKRDNARCVRGDSFLNCKFKDIPAHLVSANAAAIFSDSPYETLNRLRKDVQSFYDEFKVEQRLPDLTGNAMVDLEHLYKQLRQNMPHDDWDVEIVSAVDDSIPLLFVVYKPINDFPFYTIWSIPVKKLETSDNKTRKLLLTTFAMLHRCDMYSFPSENYDFAYCCGQFDNEFSLDEDGNPKFDQEVECEWDDDYREWATRYAFGDISRFFKEIADIENETHLDGIPVADRLCKMIDDYRQGGYENTALLNIIEELLSLSNEAWLSDFNINMLRSSFGEDFCDDIESNDEIMEFARLFFFCYDGNDPIAENVVNCINSEAYNLNVGGMCTCAIVGKDNIRQRMDSTYPARWASANLKFIDELMKDE